MNLTNPGVFVSSAKPSEASALRPQRRPLWVPGLPQPPAASRGPSQDLVGVPATPGAEGKPVGKRLGWNRGGLGALFGGGPGGTLERGTLERGSCSQPAAPGKERAAPGHGRRRDTMWGRVRGWGGAAGGCRRLAGGLLAGAASGWEAAAGVARLEGRTRRYRRFPPRPFLWGRGRPAAAGALPGGERRAARGPLRGRGLPSAPGKAAAAAAGRRRPGRPAAACAPGAGGRRRPWR